MADPADESPGDTNVYQLAEEVANGMPHSVAAYREIAHELGRLRLILSRIQHPFDGDDADCRICGEGRAYFKHNLYP